MKEFFDYIVYVEESGTQLEMWLVLGLGMGVVVGLIPLILGLIKKKTKLAFQGFVFTILGGAAMGFMTAAPVALFFLWLMFKKGDKSIKDALTDDEFEDEEFDIDDDELMDIDDDEMDEVEMK